MRKNKKITDYVLSLSLFSFLTFTLGGIMQLLSENDVVNEISLHYGRLPVLFGLSGIVFFFLIGNIRLYLQRRFTVSQSEYVVYLSDGRTDKRYVAFYDSGNRVYSRYGEKVVFVAPKVYEGLEKREEEELSVRSAGGVFSTRSIKGEVTVCDKDGKKYLYPVRIARGKYMSDKQVLLHGEMGGMA